MRERTPPAFAVLHGLTLPWLVAHARPAGDALGVITWRLGGAGALA